MDENRFYILVAKKIADELSAQESMELESILISDSLYKKIYEDLYKNVSGKAIKKSIDESLVLNNLRNKLQLVDPGYKVDIIDIEVTKDDAEIDIPHSFWQRNKAKLLLSTAMVMVLGGIFYQFSFIKSQDLPTTEKLSRNNISTKPGSKSQVTLPDGSLVILNADSKLTYPDNFLGDTREVTLEGEAFFDVAKNKNKPFIIHTTAMDIKVLGTVFNVKAYPAERISEASLISGSIEVLLKTRTKGKIMLKSNEKITVFNTGYHPKDTATAPETDGDKSQPFVSIDTLKIDKADNQITEIAWTQNKLVFSKRNFEETCQLLERYYGVKINIQGEKLKEADFTGRFYNESVNQVLNALKLTHKFNYTNTNGQIVIY